MSKGKPGPDHPYRWHKNAIAKSPELADLPVSACPVCGADDGTIGGRWKHQTAEHQSRVDWAAVPENTQDWV